MIPQCEVDPEKRDDLRCVRFGPGFGSKREVLEYVWQESVRQASFKAKVASERPVETHASRERADTDRVACEVSARMDTTGQREDTEGSPSRGYASAFNGVVRWAQRHGFEPPRPTLGWASPCADPAITDRADLEAGGVVRFQATNCSCDRRRRDLPRPQSKKRNQ